MSLPNPTLMREVEEKLAHAEDRHQQLLDGIFGKYRNVRLPKFIGQGLEEVLASTTECFDYLGKDIIEAYILPSAPKKFVTSYNGKKISALFPFYKGQLMPEYQKTPFHCLRQTAPQLFDELLRLVDQMDVGGNFLNNISIDSRDFRKIRNAVNSKKHGQSVRIVEVPGGNLYTSDGTFPGVVSAADLSVPGPKLILFPTEAKLLEMSSFQTSEGDRVESLSSTAVNGTKYLMRHFYKTYFQSSAVNPTVSQKI